MRKRARQNKTNEDETYVVDVDSTANELRIEKNPSRYIDLSKLSDCKQIHEIEFEQCPNLESIDLTVLNDSSSLRVIKILGNGTLNHITGLGTLRSIILPSGCHNLESVIIIGNVFRSERILTPADRETYSIPVGLSGFIPDRHDIVDLRVLNGGPSLKVLYIMKNRNLNRIILPSKCPNLEAVVLRGNWLRQLSFVMDPSDDDPFHQLEECPKLRFLDLSFNEALETALLFLRQYSITEQPPIIGVQFSELPIIILFFDSFPKRIKVRFVASPKDRMYNRYVHLNDHYISLLHESGIWP